MPDGPTFYYDTACNANPSVGVAAPLRDQRSIDPKYRQQR